LLPCQDNTGHKNTPLLLRKPIADVSKILHCMRTGGKRALTVALTNDEKIPVNMTLNVIKNKRQ